MVNLAQGMAFRAMKAAYPKAEVSSAFNMAEAVPASNSDADKLAAERYAAFRNYWFVNPPLKGRYPEVLASDQVLATMDVRPGDMEITKAPLDYLAINYYDRAIVSDNGDHGVMRMASHTGEEGPRTEFGWEVWPDGFHDLLIKVNDKYKPKAIEITENGCSYGDVPDDRGRVPDERRTNFFRGYLGALARVRKAGVPIRGYAAWSLMDNFEWGEGYSQRFGFVFVDFRTLKRTVKDSGKWYAQLAATGKLS